MKNFLFPALTLSSILIFLAGGCADKPLPLPPSSGSPAASVEGGGGGQISQETFASGEQEQAFGIPSPLANVNGSNSGFSGIQENTVTASGSGATGDGLEMGQLNNNDFSGSGYNTGKDDFIAGPLTDDDSRGFGNSEGRFASKLPFQTTENMKDIFFSYDKYDLTEQAKAILKRNATWLKKNPSVRVEIEGHCDERGTNNYNLSLGERRTQMTKNYLVSLGVSQKRIHIISYGEEKPFCLQSNEGCWSQNRRGHFMVSR